MNYRISLLLFLGLLSCKMDSKEKNNTPTRSYAKVMEAEVLLENLSSENLVIVDFRHPDLYRAEHITGAINIWRTDLENKDYPYPGMKPGKEELERKLGEKGLRNTDYLIVYDDKGSVDAARLWWLLRYYYFDSVSILNGGISAWKKAGGPTSNELINVEPTSFTLADSTRNKILINREQLANRVLSGNGSIKIIDVRSKDEFLGKMMKKGASKAGRIPGSMHLEWMMAIDVENVNKFKPSDQLRSIFHENGIYQHDTIVLYCHSGSRSSHMAFVLEEMLDYNWIMNYDGSWAEWSYHENLPIELERPTELKY